MLNTYYWETSNWRQQYLNKKWLNRDKVIDNKEIIIIKGKAVLLQTRRGPKGSRKLRFPDFVTTAQDGGRLSALRTGRLSPPRKYSWYSFLLDAESTPGPQCDQKGFMSMKNPMTPAGIEPATF